MSLRIQCLTIDSLDPSASATFWAEALGWRQTYADEDEVVIEPPAGSPEDGVVPDLLFIRVADLKAVKNRLHLDLRPDDQAGEVARLEALGATQVSIGQTGDEGWIVLRDPSGNEFCVLRPRRAAETDT